MKNKKRRFILYFLIGFGLALLDFFLNNFGYRADYYEKLDNFQDLKTYSFDVRLKKNGCYWIGFSSPNAHIFDYKIKGKYNLKYYNNQELLKEYNATITLGGAAYSRSDFTETVIDRIQVPLKGHHKLHIELTPIKSDNIFTKKENKIYFFMRRAILKCKKIDFEKIRREKLVEENPIDTQEKNTTLLPLYNALKEKNFIKIKSEIEKFGVNVKMLNDRVPLHYSAFFNDINTTKYLIAHGGDIHAKDFADKEPIQYAIENNATKTTKLLLESGVDVNKIGYVDPYLKRSTRSAFGKLPPLFYAACNGLYEMTKLLLEYNVDTKKILWGHNVYSYAEYDTDEKKVSKEMREKILELLKSYKIKLVTPGKIEFDKEIR